MADVINREDLQAKINRREPFHLVETLPEDQFRQGHLPGAVHLPPERVREQAGKVLPDRTAEIVVYCGSEQCNASDKAAAELERQGYTRVRRFVGGKQDWIDAGLALEGAPQEAVATARDMTVVSATAPAPR
jgi:rhodanese-related sulfurtransferase